MTAADGSHEFGHTKDFKDIAIVDPEYANGDYKKDIQPDALIAAVLA